MAARQVDDIEEAILESMAGIEDDDVVEEQADETPPHETKQDDTEAVEEEQVPETQPPTRTTRRAERQQSDSRFRRVHDSLVDDKGNIVDPNGRIIARAGAERRFYVENQRLNKLIQQRESDLVTAQKQLTDLQFLNDVPRQRGLTNDEVATALEMATLFRTPDGIGKVARWVLENAVAKGYDISQLLGDGGVGSINAAAISRMIDDRLKPITERAAKEQQVEKVANDVRAARDKFLTEYPEAIPHQQELANYMRAKNVSPERALFALREFAAVNGFDFERPIAPQIQERIRQHQSGRQPTAHDEGSRTQPHHARPMPNGGASGVSLEQARVFADPDDGYDVIVREVMRENGMM